MDILEENKDIISDFNMAMEAVKNVDWSKQNPDTIMMLIKGINDMNKSMKNFTNICKAIALDDALKKMSKE